MGSNNDTYCNCLGQNMRVPINNYNFVVKNRDS